MRDGQRRSGRRTKGTASQSVSSQPQVASSPSIPVWLSIALRCRSSIALATTAVNRGVPAGDAAGRGRRAGRQRSALLQLSRTRSGCSVTVCLLVDCSPACCCLLHCPPAVREGTRQRAARVLLCAAGRDVSRVARQERLTDDEKETAKQKWLKISRRFH